VTCGRLLAAVCLSVLLIADTVYCRIREKEIPYILSFSIFSAGENRKSWLHSSKRDYVRPAESLNINLRMQIKKILAHFTGCVISISGKLACHACYWYITLYLA
jgi:hypothetical protein